MQKLMVVTVMLTLTGCAVPQVQPIERIAFPENEYIQLKKIGTSTVKGQAFLKTRGGDVKVAAGEKVWLNPVTSYSNQWYESHLLNRPLGTADPRQDQYIKETTADGSGRFAFRNVPSGDYYITTKVLWESATGYGGGLVTQGGFISQKIKINDHEEVEIILTR